MSEFLVSLNRFTEDDWNTSIDGLLTSIHEVDRNAVQIWFRFYPLELHSYLQSADDPGEARRGLAMEGSYGLADKIDTSHKFVYGHRFWPQIKAAIEKRAASAVRFDDLAEEIKGIAQTVAASAKVSESLTLAISAVGLMTLAQVGLDAFKSAKGEAARPTGLMAKSPDQIVAERKKDDSQGLFGFLRTVDKTFSVVHDEYAANGRFMIVADQEIASASANDRSQDWQALDPRCWEGPVPVECTSASCGTCWIGVIAGQEKLTPVASRERRQMKVFGYQQPGDEKPFLRLACQARAEGNVTILIPPWNAVYGKKVYGDVQDLELEPATSSAKKLREVGIKSRAW